jgi:rubredoxin
MRGGRGLAENQPEMGAQSYNVRIILCERSSNMKTWMCLICGWIYDEAVGSPDEGIPAGTPWDQVPMNWTCPECGARKEDFEMVQI